MKSVFFIALFCLTIGVHAEEVVVQEESRHHCQKHKFTKEQHEKAQAAFFKFKEEAIYLKEAVELAQLNYKKVMSNSESTEKDYKAAADKVVESTGKALAAKLAFKSTMAHQVFSAEQRKCPFCSKRHEHHKELEEESEE